MSCAAVKIHKDKIEIACDSMTAQGDMIVPSSFMKMQKIELNDNNIKYTIVAASAGSVEVMDAFFSFIRNLDQKDYKYLNKRNSIRILMERFVKTLDDKERDYGSSNNDFLLVINDKAYYIYATLVDEIIEYRAIGSGCPYANTALLLGKSAKAAVKVATKMDVYVREPIYVIEIPKECDKNDN